MNNSKFTVSSMLSYADKTWLLSSVLFLILGIFFLFFSSLIIENDNWFFHIVFCILSSLIILVQFFFLIKNLKKEFFMDFRYSFLFMFWLYYVFGSLFLVYGDENFILERLDSNYVNPILATKIDAINILGLAIALAVASITKPLWLIKLINTFIVEVKNFNISVEKFFLISSSLSLLCFFWVFFYDLGYFNIKVLPGVIRIFKDFLLINILIATLNKGKNYKFYVILALIFSFLYFISGFLLFGKYQAIIGFVVLIFGYSIRNNSILPLGIAFLGFYLLLSNLGNISQYSRENYSEDSKNILERIKIINLALNEVNDDANKIKYSLWNRINYMNTQAAAVELYESEDGGEDYKLIPWVFVPRIIYKDKPNISKIGSDFYKKISGLTGSSDSAGIFIDSYYNLGWTGLILGAIVVGWIIAFYCLVGKIILMNNLYPLFFLIFFGLHTSFRIDGRIIDDYIGLFVIVVYLTLILLLFFKIIRFVNKLKSKILFF